MHLRHGCAHGACLTRGRTADRNAGQEFEQGNRLVVDHLEGTAFAVVNRRRHRATGGSEVIEQTGRIVGKPVPHSVGPRRPGDSPKLVGNIAHAKKTLGWTPTRDLATQIEDALRWRRKMPR